MTTIVPAILEFLDGRRAPANGTPVARSLDALVASDDFAALVDALTAAPACSPELARELARVGAVPAISPCRMLRGSFNLTLDRFFTLLAQVASAFADPARDGARASEWSAFAERVHASDELSGVRLASFATTHLDDAGTRSRYAATIERLVRLDPHAIYPTSAYRESDGSVEQTPDGRTIEAVMSLRTFSSLRIVDRSLDAGTTALRDIYRPLGRCVCLVDANVDALYGAALERYFAHHGIELHKRVYRAMEIDKGLATVERMLGDFKALGVSRDEPVLLAGGGVIADTGGLACALYGRNTPYVMLATSIVSGIDAGPSPRTCCDGYGYKNLIGAYHPPVVAIADRFFFQTLHEGWLRHGIAEIAKIAIVADAALFADLEAARSELIPTRFGTVGCAPGGRVDELSQRILGGALRAYVAAEYDNLYETHQCRPHAYGHTWSPGFEMGAGLLHGHAVAICMGFGAYLSHRRGWIDGVALERILALLDAYGLSLWHDVLADGDAIWHSQQIVVQKRGRNLVAPLPKGGIGGCGYLDALPRAELDAALDGYAAMCARYPRGGRGIDALCTDVGLEHPGTTESARLSLAT